MQQHKHAEMTDWFPGDVKPVRPGVYETKEPDGSIWFNEFDGFDWFYGNHACVPSKSRTVLPSERLISWRGLASDPNPPTTTDEQTDDSTGIVEVSE